MIDRRGFLCEALGLSIGSNGLAAAFSGAASRGFRTNTEQTVYERLFGGTTDIGWLGVPLCWSEVREGLHPISPKRFFILDAALRKRYSGDLGKLKERVTECLGGELKGSVLYSDEKLTLILGMMDIMGSYYRRPDLFEAWSRRLAHREALGSTSVGRGVVLLHDFQGRDEQAPIVNCVSDWWLFLFPDGADWDSCDGKPVHLMGGAAFYRRETGPYLRTLELMGRVFGHNGPEWASALVRMDRVRAARLLNLHVGRAFVASKYPTLTR